MAVIAVIGLLVFGPKNCSTGRSLGKTLCFSRFPE